MKYRIVIETELSGKKWYYVQKRFYTYFWRYCETINMSMSLCRVVFLTLKEAEEYLQHDVNCCYQKEQSKIIKREYINR